MSVYSNIIHLCFLIIFFIDHKISGGEVYVCLSSNIIHLFSLFFFFHRSVKVSTHLFKNAHLTALILLLISFLRCLLYYSLGYC